jgi:hypothetical protein
LNTLWYTIVTFALSEERHVADASIYFVKHQLPRGWFSARETTNRKDCSSGARPAFSTVPCSGRGAFTHALLTGIFSALAACWTDSGEGTGGGGEVSGQPLESVGARLSLLAWSAVPFK